MTPPVLDTPPRLRRLARIAFAIAGVWLCVGIYSTAKYAYQAPSERTPLAIEASFLNNTLFMIGWMLVTPLIGFVSQKLPVRQPHRARNTLLLLPICLALAAVPPLLFYLFRSLNGAQAYVRSGMVWRGAWANAIVVLVIVVGAQYLEAVRRNAEQRRIEAELAAEIARAQLQQLRAGLDPHFLFNSLNAVAALLHDCPAEAGRMLLTLTDLLQRTFASHVKPEVTLAEEIAFIERYLLIQKTRFRDRMDAAVNVPGSLGDALVPPLVLQPLVENAVVHGVARSAGAGSVEVTAWRDGERLILIVRDSGDGFEHEPPDHGSIGIPNTRARLRLIYGDRQSLVFGRTAGMFEARVTIPLRMSTERT